MTRLPLIAEDKMTDAQRAALKIVTAGKRAGVAGPFAALMRSPELCSRAAQLGEFVRFNTSFPPRLSERAILVTAAQWRAQYEWFAHAQLALKGGLAPDIVEAIRTGKKPEKMQADEAVVYDFCTELHTSKRVSDATYARATAAFGETGVVEMVGISGYYVLVGMTLNVAKVALPEGQSNPFPE